MGKRILLPVLDWGLGHASRMVPVIECLSANGASVTLASSGAAALGLRRRFPEMAFAELPAREVRYGRRGAGMALFKQAILQKQTNKAQHAWTLDICNQQGFDGIISDNVYGAWHPDIPSVLMSHQLSLPSPFLKNIINKELAEWLNCFSEVWVPDFENGIAGALCSNASLSKPKRYLGTLSRLEPQGKVTKELVCTALLSKPEPQRSIFEAEILRLFASMPGPKALVRGLTKEGAPLRYLPRGCTVHPFLDGDALALLLQSSQFVLCRSGFSSLSDLSKLACKAVVVPTPGQPEQQYLAKRCGEKKWFVPAAQGRLGLPSQALFDASAPPAPVVGRLAPVVGQFLKAC